MYMAYAVTMTVSDLQGNARIADLFYGRPM